MRKTSRQILLLLLLFVAAPQVRADKGMWLINQLKKENLDRMHRLGFKLNAEDLYSTTSPSIANAVVIFDGGCSGVTVSDQGLIFTNHHCGYSSIQKMSSVQHDYLRDGFVSQSQAQELPIPGLKVHYLREMIDITEQVEAAARGAKSESERQKLIWDAAQELVKPYQIPGTTTADVYPFYEHNAYFIVVYDEFTDVRMVFAPPSSMGKFGGDTDNWMWPRHTNDFSVFRVYANADNKPAPYSATNKPYRPKAFIKISLQGVQENDFAMTIGFPGSTDRYLSSWGVISRMRDENEPRILVRGIKQEIWKKHMEADQATRIMYANKYAGSSNYWKNSIGMNRGLKRLNVVAQKQEIEREFERWVSSSERNKARYGEVLDSLRIPLQAISTARHDRVILTEALSGMEGSTLSAATLVQDPKTFDVEKYYKNYSPAVAKDVVPAMLRVVREQVQPENLPSIYKKIDSEYGGSYDKYVADLFEHSVVVDRNRVVKAMEKFDAFKTALPKDPAIELVNSFREAIAKTQETLMAYNGAYSKGRRLFFAGLREMWPDRALPSDANFTMRLSYGTVSGYKPYDAGYYDYYTTEDGIFEKQDSTSSEFAVQPEILALLHAKKFGQYAAPDHKLHLNFISNNDITGGNSGSPVFDKNGNLIGLAFDGNWEAMSGDIEFEPKLQRTISVDIRYVLWAIDVWGKSRYLMDELTLVK